ncbi:unnamed protein product [Durusdinium trenchii]|uniref:Uncharacterized protein n=1 Tax=Durusdinium trenchii TaxID=1381693 RepID=A0ABP0R6N8_9DINO
MYLVSLMFGIQSLSFDPLEDLETFSGCMSITRAEWEARRAAVPMDVVLSSDHDILSDVGYANMLHQVLRLRPGSGKFTAPVCSTWVFMSRGSTGRSSQRPLGKQEYKSVQDANIMVARVVILLLLCEARKIWWMLEQPVNSLLERHPLFEAFLRLPSVHVRRLTTAMCWFGGRTRKPTWVYSSHPEVSEINNYADHSLIPENTAEMVVHYVDSSGKQRIKGGGDLKASQAYPRRRLCFKVQTTR